MKPDLTRRGFCSVMGTGLVIIGVPGCGAPVTPPGGNNDLDGDSNADMTSAPDAGDPGDLARQTDLARLPPDLEPAACGTAQGQFSTNRQPGSFAQGTATFFMSGQAQFFICRDAKGLYALDSRCTHSGCTV